MRGDDELERDNFSEFSFERLADQTSVSRGSFQVSYIFGAKCSAVVRGLTLSGALFNI